MLTLKRISKNKLIIYLVIIAAMISGTSLLLVKNYWLTTSKAPAIDMPVPAELGNLTKTVDTTISQNINIEATAPDSSSQPITQATVIDISFFASKKFQDLKANLTVSAKSKKIVGKKNPFEW